MKKKKATFRIYQSDEVKEFLAGLKIHNPEAALEIEQALQRTQKSLESRASELSQANIAIEELRGERDSLKRQLTHFERSRESIRRFRSTLHDVLVTDGSSPEKSGSPTPQKL